MTDLVSNLLDLVRVRGTAYFSKNVESPWGMDVDQHTDLCRFHLVLAGSTWIGLQDNAACEHLLEGDFVIVPRGKAHFLDDQVGRPARTQHSIPRPSETVTPQFQKLDRCSDKTHLLCGYFQFAQEPPLAIISRMPDLLVVRKSKNYHYEQIARVIAMLQVELSHQSPSPQVVMNRLTEVMFYHAVRGWLDDAILPGEALNALASPKLQRVLDEIHKNPSEPWTVESLAEVAGQSRTAFAAFFKEAIGLTPITYIARWRTELARKYLNESDLALDEIAIQTGYNDTSAFSRAFKRATGSSPSVFRRSSRS